jgi:hypothetical protein
VGLIGLERVDANDGELPPPTVVRSHFRGPVVKHPRFLVRLGGPFSRPGLNVAQASRATVVKHGRTAATGAAGLCLTAASTAPGWFQVGIAIMQAPRAATGFGQNVDPHGYHAGQSRP